MIQQWLLCPHYIEGAVDISSILKYTDNLLLTNVLKGIILDFSGTECNSTSETYTEWSEQVSLRLSSQTIDS